MEVKKVPSVLFLFIFCRISVNYKLILAVFLTRKDIIRCLSLVPVIRRFRRLGKVLLSFLLSCHKRLNIGETLHFLILFFLPVHKHNFTLKIDQLFLSWSKTQFFLQCFKLFFCSNFVQIALFVFCVHLVKFAAKAPDWIICNVWQVFPIKLSFFISYEKSYGRMPCIIVIFIVAFEETIFDINFILKNHTFNLHTSLKPIF